MQPRASAFADPTAAESRGPLPAASVGTAPRVLALTSVITWLEAMLPSAPLQVQRSVAAALRAGEGIVSQAGAVLDGLAEDMVERAEVAAYGSTSLPVVRDWLAERLGQFACAASPGSDACAPFSAVPPDGRDEWAAWTQAVLLGLPAMGFPVLLGNPDAPARWEVRSTPFGWALFSHGVPSDAESHAHAFLQAFGDLMVAGFGPAGSPGLAAARVRAIATLEPSLPESGRV